MKHCSSFIHSVVSTLLADSEGPDQTARTPEDVFSHDNIILYCTQSNISFVYFHSSYDIRSNKYALLVNEYHFVIIPSQEAHIYLEQFDWPRAIWKMAFYILIYCKSTEQKSRNYFLSRKFLILNFYLTHIFNINIDLVGML